MARIYEWSIKRITKSDSSDLNGVIVGTQWKLIGTDDDGEFGQFDGATPFPISNVNPDDFTPYEELTEELVLGWVKNVASSSNDATYWAHIDGQITKEINKKRNSIIDVPVDMTPWYTGSVFTYPSASLPPV
jgi:hypothetical protein